MTYKFQSEENSKTTKQLNQNWENLLDRAETLDLNKVLDWAQIQTITFPELKCGRGGSHVWIANQNNERIAVVYETK